LAFRKAATLAGALMLVSSTSNAADGAPRFCIHEAQAVSPGASLDGRVLLWPAELVRAAVERRSLAGDIARVALVATASSRSLIATAVRRLGWKTGVVTRNSIYPLAKTSSAAALVRTNGQIRN
jgi:hypothetical protein